MLLTQAKPRARTHLEGAEADVAEVENGGEDGPDGGDVVGAEADSLKALKQNLEVLLVPFSA